jgi:putative addiction module component (TIGR02574 family)
VSKPALDLTNLSSDEKFELLDDVWRSLRPEDFDLSPDLRAELDARLDRIGRDGPGGLPWADVRKRITSSRT